MSIVIIVVTMCFVCVVVSFATVFIMEDYQSSPNKSNRFRQNNAAAAAGAASAASSSALVFSTYSSTNHHSKSKHDDDDDDDDDSDDTTDKWIPKPTSFFL
jgi:heme/copper-type cytochrome/quinol oxidase subunit 2